MFLVAACSQQTEDASSTIASCSLSGTDAACSAPTASVTAGPSLGSAPEVSVGVTYDVAAAGQGQRGYVLFFPETTGVHTLYFGDEQPVRVCDETALCKSRVESCPAFAHAAQYQLIAGQLYEIELRPGAESFVLHIAGPSVDEPPPGGGDVAFGDPITYAAGTTPRYLETADLDGDGALDLVVSTPDDASGLTTIDLLQGSPAGAFDLVAQVDTSAPGDTVIADFDGDGTLDIVGVAFDGQGPLPHFFLRGLGDFRYDMTTWGAGRELRPRISAGDFDEDGVVDIVASLVQQDLAIPGGFAITSVPSFTILDEHISDGAFTRTSVAGDFDGDGHQDVIESRDDSGTLYRFAGDGTGEVVAAGTIDISAGVVLQLAAIDLDGDGADDLIALQESTASILYGGAAGLSDPLVLDGLAFPNGVGVGDFDADGRLDLAIGELSSVEDSAIAIFVATDAGFTRAATLSIADTGYRGDLAVADYNGDGSDDIAATTIGGVAIFLAMP